MNLYAGIALGVLVASLMIIISTAIKIRKRILYNHPDYCKGCNNLIFGENGYCCRFSALQWDIDKELLNICKKHNWRDTR